MGRCPDKSHNLVLAGSTPAPAIMKIPDTSQHRYNINRYNWSIKNIDTQKEVISFPPYSKFANEHAKVRAVCFAKDDKEVKKLVKEYTEKKEEEE